MNRMNLSGKWGFCLDNEKVGLDKGFFNMDFLDSIELPTTVSEAKKGEPSDRRDTGYLTDPYATSGYAWYTRIIDVEAGDKILTLERTRISHLWVDGEYFGSRDSLCTSHRYEITLTEGAHRITIMTDNSSYPVPGGHMTSPDTQTNWNGITGKIFLEDKPAVRLENIMLFPNVTARSVHVTADIVGAEDCAATVFVGGFPAIETTVAGGFDYVLGETAELWSEFNPALYTMKIALTSGAEYSITFGLREFFAEGKNFTINGIPTFLRGKHDGMIFPLTGYAPTDVESWLHVLSVAKSYGINHYRFHTCCPPDAAFTAADILGIYMQPELPFWGTITEPGEEGHDEAAQQYLIREGFNILREFGNHPSFALMSMGNELWGSKEILNRILGQYKAFDNRHLYTQGSNNFQFYPCILENDDFFSGVRFSENRLFRGSYAMCDAPQGHIQVSAPNSSHNYDKIIRPDTVSSGTGAGGEIEIQYGTGVKKVSAAESAEFIPNIPAVSHEVGQYASYPDFSEIDKYTGVLKARNFEVFRERLFDSGMGEAAVGFAHASGRFAAECYKQEIETAMRSGELGGFQLLDIQDFSGQGTALVGILNAFMESKGDITREEWRCFCSDTVILPELASFIVRPGQTISVGVRLHTYTEKPVNNPVCRLEIFSGNDRIFGGTQINEGRYFGGVYELSGFTVKIPENLPPCKLGLRLSLCGSEVYNREDLWCFGECDISGVNYTTDPDRARAILENGGNVLLLPKMSEENSIEGTYCTDFWCYPMFLSISESMGKPTPIGTHGLMIDNDHAALRKFPTERYSTPQWYEIISAARAAILDDTDLSPIVWDIDNFERNHKLGIIFEAKAFEGKLLCCTAPLCEIAAAEAHQLLLSLSEYVQSEEFAPEGELSAEEYRRLFR